MKASLWQAPLILAAPLVGAMAIRFVDPIADALTRTSAPPLLVRPWAPRHAEPHTIRLREREVSPSKFAWIVLDAGERNADAVAKGLTSGRRALAPVAVRCQVPSRATCELRPEALDVCIQAGPKLGELEACGPETPQGRSLLAFFQQTAAVGRTQLAEDCLREACTNTSWADGDERGDLDDAS